jgi:hypothetical protein
MKTATNLVLIFVLSVFMACFSANLLCMGRQAIDWPSLAAQMIVSQTYGVEGRRRGIQLEIGYRYLVNGTIYTANRYGYTVDAPQGAQAASFFAAHPVGSPIKVHVNPANPSQAVVEVGPESAMPYALLMAVSVFFAFGSAIAIAIGQRHRS